MAQLTTVFFDKIRPYKRTIFIIFMVILFAVIVYYLYYKVIRPTVITKEKGYDDIPNRDKNEKNGIEIILWYATWCPICVKSKPAWDDFRKQYEGQLIHNKTVVFTEIDCSDENNPNATDMIQQYNIQGFPTIKAIVEGKTIDYDAKVTKENLDIFISSI
jgi:thiol-disulfide isomerase/thioredoxin